MSQSHPSKKRKTREISFHSNAGRVTIHDKGTFLVRSRTSKGDSYLVDSDGWTCTCDGYLFRHGADPDYRCWHIRRVQQLLGEYVRENNIQ